jgi:hypothetical protein
MGRSTKGIAAMVDARTLLRRVLVSLVVVVASVMVLTCVPTRAQAAEMTFSQMTDRLTTLEGYADSYVASSSSNEYTAQQLVPMYVRSERYDSTQWTIVGGDPSGFIAYCAEQDAANGTDVQGLRTAGDENGNFTLPNGDVIDIIHLFAVINAYTFASSDTSADLGGWAGDACQMLAENKTVTGTADEVYAKVALTFDTLGNSNTFGRADLIADLDGYNLSRTKVSSPSTSYAALLESYFTADLDDISRVQTFDSLRFPSAVSRSGFRTAVTSAYSENVYIQGIHIGSFLEIGGLEDSYGVRGSTYDLQRTACQNVFADYLASFMPVVDSVTVDPATASVAVGHDQTFVSTVLGENRPSQDVTWTVEGASSAETTIDADGTLHVAADETSTTLTVTATSVVDETESASATVTVLHPAVNGVSVTPTSTSVTTGRDVTLTATVDAIDGASTDVTWTVEGASSAETTIDADGTLHVAADETSTALTVIATSVFDPTESASATVTVTPAPKVIQVVEAVEDTIGGTLVPQPSESATPETGDGTSPADVLLVAGLALLATSSVMRRARTHR